MWAWEKEAGKKGKEGGCNTVLMQQGGTVVLQGGGGKVQE